ncbi:MAG TPA: glutamate-cysteine ligase family protein [Thermoanaerobaculia bacterium]|nr:glutamate-cysteine ligase family protein [Thermoanaerobaculia bacterium]
MSWSLFEVVGVELEYGIVRVDDLGVEPAAERLLEQVAGEPGGEVVGDPVSWSNELAAHVLEFKLERPAPALEGLAAAFQIEVRRALDALAPLGCRLLPGGCHPWMDPRRESRLWRGEGHEVYETFDRIFGCRSHGWMNLQSLHLNLPFHGDAEFDRLHSAIRVVLPLLPGLAASSPFLEGAATGLLDARLASYRTHCATVTSFAGEIVPEPLTGRREYEERIYDPIRRDLERVDPSGVLQPEWTNARGAIARFDRGAIEIRLIDVQECPRMDLAVAALTVGAVRTLVERGDPSEQRAVPAAALATVLSAAIRDADRATLEDPGHLAALGLARPAPLAEIWSALRDRVERERPGELAEHAPALDLIRDRGVLARRILRATGEAPDRDRLREAYRGLADCLDRGEPFTAG